MTDKPNLGELKQAAQLMRQMFEAYLSAGFDEDQAIKILVGMMAANTRTIVSPPTTPNGRVN